MEISQIESEVGALQKEIDEAEKEKRALEYRILDRKKLLDAWLMILRSKRGVDASAPAPLTQEQEPPDQVVSWSIAVPSSAADQDNGYGSKSRSIRMFVWNHRKSGVPLRDLARYAVQIGAHQNMAYRLVARLSEGEAPEFERRNGRVFPTRHLRLEESATQTTAN